LQPLSVLKNLHGGVVILVLKNMIQVFNNPFLAKHLYSLSKRTALSYGISIGTPPYET